MRSSAINLNRNTRKRFAQGGFTLVEVMVVAATIGLLASIAVPGMRKARENAENGAYIGNLRTAVSAFELYSLENGAYPADKTPGIMPAGMEDYLAKMDWAGETPIGGKWDWDYGVFGVTAGVSVKDPTVPLSQLQRLDAHLDDGNLETGSFRRRAGGYISVIEE
jgi:prepilin-type N-terminal cleavage/methylation domain-containing protein